MESDFSYESTPWDPKVSTYVLDWSMTKHYQISLRTNTVEQIAHRYNVIDTAVKYWPNHPFWDILMVASLLHDTEVPLHEIAKGFSPATVSLIDEIRPNNKSIHRLGKNRYLINKMLSVSDNALFLMLCDRLVYISKLPSITYKFDTRKMCRALTGRCGNEPYLTLLHDLYTQACEKITETADDHTVEPDNSLTDPCDVNIMFGK